MTQTIVITSGKGGVGKTNISVNTAIELAQRNHRTCLFDADLGLANVNILLGIQPEHTLDDHIFGNKSLDEIILRTEYGIDVIPGSSGIEKMANLDRDETSRLICSLGEISGYDFFVIDTSSGISRSVLAFCLASNETIIVITAEATSLTDAYALLKIMSLKEYGGTVKILVNRSPSVPQAKETYLRFKEVVSKHLQINIAPVGIILSDPNIERAISSQQPALILYPESLASQCIKAMVSNLLKNNSHQQQTDDLGEFWQRYFDYALPDLSEPEKPHVTSQPKSSFKLESYTIKSEPPQNVPAASPHQVTAHPVQHDQQTESEPEPLHPFLYDDWILEPAELSPPVPLLSKALAIQARGEIAEDELYDFFCWDPVLMVKALRLHCSREPGARKTRRLTTKKQLLDELGKDILVNILNTTAMQGGSFLQQSLDTTKTVNSFWLHSYQSAILAEKIAEITAYPFPEEAFIAGLIHDIGRLALQISHPEMYRESCDSFHHDGTLINQEKSHFNMSHAEMGAKALRAWQLDSLLVDAVQYHTEPFARIETAFNLVKIVYLAARLNIEDGVDQEASNLGKHLFGLSQIQLQNMVISTTKESETLAKKLGILQPEEMDDQIALKTESRFRQQLLDYAMLHGVLPPITYLQETSTIISTVSRAFNILFSFQASFILLMDQEHQLLKAVEFPGCFGVETVTEIQFSLHWQKSLVVQSCNSGKLKIAIDGESSGVLPLADRQLLRALGTQGFVCLPLSVRGKTMGVVVFGIATSHIDTIKSLEERLMQFGYQAARNISTMEDKPLKLGESYAS